MEHPTIDDLPNELLEMIFNYLDVYNLKHASLVCKRWSDLAFSGQRVDRVLLLPKFPCDNDLLLTNRQYRHLQFRETSKSFASVKKLLQTFNVSSLRLKGFSSCHSRLRLILFEVPNLQHLKIPSEPRHMNEMSEPLPVMRKLERLEIVFSDLKSSLPWHTIAPSLQGLNMFCYVEAQLEQWRLFSGQLKQVYVHCNDKNVLNRFCEMTFPLLEELSIEFSFCIGMEALLPEHDVFRRHEFFRRNASLRLLRLDGIYLSKTLVEDITNHSKKLTSLEIVGDRDQYERNGEPGSLESLSQLTELKHLSLEKFETSIFRGCKVLTSLESLFINNTKIGHKGTFGSVKDLLKIAPQLRCMEFGSVRMKEKPVQLICNKFPRVTRLQLTYSEKISRDGLSGIDRLLHLRYLELRLTDSNTFFTSIIPENKVRYLTLHLDYKYEEDDLLRLPEIFPQLDGFNLINLGLRSLRESTVDKLRKLLSTCTIQIYGHLVTNAGRKRCFREWTRSEIMPIWEKDWVWTKTDAWEWF